MVVQRLSGVAGKEQTGLGGRKHFRRSTPARMNQDLPLAVGHGREGKGPVFYRIARHPGMKSGTCILEDGSTL